MSPMTDIFSGSGADFSIRIYHLASRTVLVLEPCACRWARSSFKQLHSADSQVVELEALFAPGRGAKFRSTQPPDHDPWSTLLSQLAAHEFTRSRSRRKPDARLSSASPLRPSPRWP
eukprot:446928-Prymnesium_polylepis.2